MSNNKTWDKLVELTKENHPKNGHNSFEVTFDELFEIIKLNWPESKEPKLIIEEPESVYVKVVDEKFIHKGRIPSELEVREFLHTKLGGDIIKIVPDVFYDVVGANWIYIKFDFIGENGKEVYHNPKLLEN